MTLQLIPNGDLVFKGPFNTVSMTGLSLSNTGNERLAYKIKTTAPKRYCVKPNSGFLDSLATTNVQVMLQPQPSGQEDDRSKHKFMVQWAEVPSSYTADVETFWKQDLSKSKVHDSKLKCVFSEEQPAAVVPNDSFAQKDSDTGSARATQSTNTNEAANQQQNNKTELTTSTTLSQRSVTNIARDTNVIQAPCPERQQNVGEESEKPRLKNDLERLKGENESLKERLKQQELRHRTNGSDRVDNPVVDRFKSQHQQKGPALFGVALTNQLLLVVLVIALLLGFSLGFFLFSCGN